MTEHILPPLHPMIDDQIERQRCPECGLPGRVVFHIDDDHAVWACEQCEPELFAPDWFRNRDATGGQH